MVYSSQIIGPTVFGLTYMASASVFPQAIFVLCLGSVVIAFICMLFIRIRSDHETQDKKKGVSVRIEREIFVDEPASRN